MIWIVVFLVAAGLIGLLFYKGAPLKYDRADFKHGVPPQPGANDGTKKAADPW